MSQKFLIVFCGLLLASNAFSTDVLLPAVFAMERDLAAPITTVQITMPLFIFASAFGQLLYGSASDRFGRKPVLLAGLAVYTVAALVATLAQSITVVLVARAFQGLGSAAGIVIGRAILRDTHAGPELARTMALAMAMISFGPILAPLAGTGLVALGGWRLSFAAMVSFGLVMSAVALTRLGETNKALRPDALDLAQLREAGMRVLSHPQSRFFLMLAGALGFLIISFIAHAPRFFKTAFGIEGLAFAAAFGVMGLGIIVGQFINSRAITAFGVLPTTRVGLAVLTAVCGLLALLAAVDRLSPVTFGVLMFLFNCAFLSLMANAASLTLDPHPDIAGLASSIFGFVTQMVPGGLALLTLGLIGGEVVRWAAVVSAITLGLLVSLLRYRPTLRMTLAA
jgi:DHA1 family bicyclomycin/chloramphenicol resistance-like MFS transporter